MPQACCWWKRGRGGGTYHFWEFQITAFKAQNDGDKNNNLVNCGDKHGDDSASGHGDSNSDVENTCPPNDECC